MKKIFCIVLCLLSVLFGLDHALGLSVLGNEDNYNLSSVREHFHSMIKAGNQNNQHISFEMFENSLRNLYISDKSSEAKSELERLFEEKIDDLSVLRLGIEILEKRNQDFEIIDLCNSFIRKHPENIDARWILNEVYSEQGDKQLAQEQITRILELDPNNFSANIAMGKRVYSENKPLQAIQYFSKAQMLDPQNIISYIELGKVYYEQNELGAAIEELEKGKKVKAEDLKRGKSVSLAELGDYEKKVHAENLELFVWLGLAYQKAKQDSKAVETIRLVLETDPSNDLMRIELAKIYLAQAEYAKASEQLESVSEAKDLAYEKNVMLAFCYGALAQLRKMRLIVAANPRVFAIMIGAVVLLCLISLGIIGALFITAFMIGKKTRSNSGKYKNINWSLHQAFFVCIVLFTLPLFLEILIGRIIYNNWILFLSPAKDIHSKAGQNALLSQLVTVVFTCAVVLWFTLKRNGQSLRDLGFRWIRLRKFAVLAFKAILMMFLFNIIYMGLFTSLSGTQPEQQYIAELIAESGKSRHLIFLFFFAVIIGPFAEEIIFRGFIYSGLRKHCSFMSAAIISACIFGIFHLQETLFLPLAFMGFILARMFERTRSILPAAVVHMLWNFISFMNLIFLS